jgi:hypothetical protein
MNEHFSIPEMEQLKWFACDLDGTIAYKSWSPGGDDFKIGAPMVDNIKKLEKVHEAGFKIVIFTARPYSHYELIESWCKEYVPQIPIRAIVCGKLLFHMLVDDRAINADAEDWVPKLASLAIA